MASNLGAETSLINHDIFELDESNEDKRLKPTMKLVQCFFLYAYLITFTIYAFYFSFCGCTLMSLPLVVYEFC
jgi:hypothetical protein